MVAVQGDHLGIVVGDLEAELLDIECRRTLRFRDLDQNVGAKDDFTELRASKGFQPGERVRLTFLAESFNQCNRVNQRVDTSDDGFLNSGKSICGLLSPSGKALYPGEFVKNFRFLIPTNSYAQRPTQLAVKASFFSELARSIRHLCAAPLQLRWGHF